MPLSSAPAQPSPVLPPPVTARWALSPGWSHLSALPLSARPHLSGSFSPKSAYPHARMLPSSTIHRCTHCPVALSAVGPHCLHARHFGLPCPLACQAVASPRLHSLPTAAMSRTSRSVPSCAHRRYPLPCLCLHARAHLGAG
jgi:hypothetical protein